jgi:hypothetical protein
MKDPNKPYLDKEFKELAEKVGLLNPNLEYHTADGTRFYIERMLQTYSIELKNISELKNEILP